MVGIVLTHEIPRVDDAAAAIRLFIRVEHLDVCALRRHADAEALMHLGCEVMHTDEEVARIVRAAHERDDAVLIVIAVDPLEPAPVEIHLPKACIFDVKLIERLGIRKHLRMHRVLLHQMPVHTVVEVPLDEMTELTAHKEQLFPRMRDPVAEEPAQSCELLPVVARHLFNKRAFAVHDLVVRERKDEILGERIHE